MDPSYPHMNILSCEVVKIHVNNAKSIAEKKRKKAQHQRWAAVREMGMEN